MDIYLIGSLRNPKVPELGRMLRLKGHDVFDDWHCAGPNADDEWRSYEQARGHTYKEALAGYAANHVFHYDLEHLNRASVAVLVAPAGKSAHLEFGFFLGKGKPGFILLEDEPDRWDVMVKFATVICFSQEDIICELAKLD